MAKPSLFIWELFALLLLSTYVYGSRHVNCSTAPTDVLVLIDITTEDDSAFLQKQQRIVETLRYISDKALYQSVTYGVIAFHKRPIVLLPLTSPLSRYNERVIEYIQSLKPRRKFETSPAKALELAAQHFNSFGRKTACLLVIIANDGNSTDVISESIEAKNRITSESGHIFAIATSENVEIHALVGYTGSRERVYYKTEDEKTFLDEVHQLVGACEESGKPQKVVLKPSPFAFGVRSLSDGDQQKFDSKFCKSNLVDLVVLLDTSGSVHETFNEQRAFASNLIEPIEASAFSDGRLQASYKLNSNLSNSETICVIEFSSTPSVAIPMKATQSKDDVLKRISQIEFTGSSTRISSAIRLGLTELERSQRPNANQVFVLISDGHGQEYWSTVQETSKRLQNANLEVYAVTTSKDYSLPELTLYAGDESRVFVGPKQASFLHTVTTMLNNCLGKTSSFKNPEIVSDTSPDNESVGRKNQRFKTNVEKHGENVSISTVEPHTEKESSTESPMNLSKEGTPGPKTPLESEKETTGPQTPLESEKETTGPQTPLESEKETTGPQTPLESEKETTGPETSLESGKETTGSKTPLESEKETTGPQTPLESEKETTGSKTLLESEKETTGPETSLESGKETTGSKTPLESEKETTGPETPLESGKETTGPETPLESEKENTGSKTPETLKTPDKSVVTRVSETDEKETKSEPSQKLKNTAKLSGHTEDVFSGRDVFTELTLQNMSKSNQESNNVKVEELTTKQPVIDIATAEPGKFIPINEKNVTEKQVEPATELLKIEPKSCNVDLLFLIDRSMSVESEFRKQLNFAQDLVKRLMVDDVNMKRIQIGVVSFALDAQVELEFGMDRDIEVMNKEIAAIEHTGGETSLVSGVALATKFAQSTRRPKAELVLFLVSDGKGQDEWDKVVKEANILHTLPNAHFYAVSFSETYSLEELEKFVGNKNHVFLDKPSEPFIDQAEGIINTCIWDTTTETDLTPKDEGQQENVTPVTPAECGPLDLVVLFDRTSPTAKDFEAARATVSAFFKNIPSADFNSKINTALVTFDSEQKLETSLTHSTPQSVLVSIVENVQRTMRNSSVAKAVERAVKDIRLNHRPNAKLVVVIFSDGGIRNCSKRAVHVINDLHSFGGDYYAVFYSQTNVRTELMRYTGSNDRVIENNVENVLKTINLNTTCFVNINENDVNKENTVISFRGKDDSGHEVESKEAKQLGQLEGVIAVSPPTRSTETTSTVFSPVASVNSSCLVDLMLIIDRSQSVEKEFQDQLNFAVELVKRIQPLDLSGRVRVGTISFARAPKIEFPFGKYTKNSEIVEALLSIQHTGGSTSVVKGVNLAVDEIKRTARKNARLMVVLVSDGNSQDLWKDVISAAERLQATNANVYAVTVSHDYYFRELELYTGNKWYVYLDARIRQFLDQAEMSVTQCQEPNFPSSSVLTQVVTETNVAPKTSENRVQKVSPSVTSKPIIEGSIHRPLCMSDLVDLIFILDTSSSIENEFYAEKKFALDLVKALPDNVFEQRVAISLVQFASDAKLQFGFGKQKTKGDVLYELERVEYTAGQTSLVAGSNEALKEIAAHHRSNARLVIVFITDGNSQDPWIIVQSTAKKLHETGGEIYAVTLSRKYSMDELKEYTSNENHIYVDGRIEKFIEDVSASVMTCNKKSSTSDDTVPERLQFYRDETFSVQSRKQDFFANSGDRIETAFSIDAVEKCRYSKIDLEIILDASSSRQDVFEHQRELALSLVERLPIGVNETHVAVGINSFTDVPTLRQTLGLGRDKQMVRHAIEDIKYTGGNTLTANAVELSVEDLERGRRPDAVQVVVLMNDGISQDTWRSVVKASNRLKSATQERFGVALGDQIDLRELRRYIGNDNRIYRDGETERFLSDVVSLLTSGKECEAPVQKPAVDVPTVTTMADECELPNLDLVIVFDNSDGTENLSDPSISLNRFLLLDVLGSLPDTWDSGKLKLSLISFANEPTLTVSFANNENREAIFKKVEGIVAQHGRANYAKAIDLAVREYEEAHRADARGLLLIVGSGHSYNTEQAKDAALTRLDKHMELLVLAVDSGTNLDVQNLAAYTSSPELVYGYDRNAEFARDVLKEASPPEGCEKKEGISAAVNQIPLQDIPSQENEKVQQLESEKVIVKNKDFDDKARGIEGIKIKSTTSRSFTSASTRSPTPTRTTRILTTRSYTTRSSTTRRTTQRVTYPSTTVSPTTRNVTTYRRRQTTTPAFEETTPYVPGCMLDVLVIIDASGSVQETFERQKELAASIIERLRIGERNGHVAIIKFAAEGKVKSVWPFGSPQSKKLILRSLQSLSFSSGVTAIDKALLHAVNEYQTGGRPGSAAPVGIIFTDGFGQKDASEAAIRLRAIMPNMYAIAINHQYPINRPELEKIAGSSDRVFTDSNINQLHAALAKFSSGC